MKLICPVCSKEYEKSISHYNRAIKLGAKLYCSKQCFSIGRKLEFNKHLKTPEQLKAEKSAYDKERRKKLSKELKIKRKSYYEANKEKILPKMRVYNKSRMASHVVYCRQPEQREKERTRRRKNKGLDKVKVCICCNHEKQFIDFESYLVFPDGRNYMCKQCEDVDVKELQITTREVLQTIRSALHKHESVLTIRDLTPYPYLIEAHKYLLLLKRLTK